MFGVVKMDKRKQIVLISLIVIAIGFILMRSCSVNRSTSEEGKELNFQPFEDEQLIKIPARESLTFAANTLSQSVSFGNPAENSCFLQVSLFLSDGTMIYQSDLLKPSEMVSNIILTQKLERGIYKDCLIRYDGFSLDDKSGLNSGEVLITLYSR